MREDYTYKGKIRAFDFCLFWLSLIQYLSNITLFYENEIFSMIAKGIRPVFYFLLLYIVFQKRYSFNKFLIFSIITCLLTYGMFKSEMSAFVFAWLFIIASKGENYERIIKKLYLSMWIVLIVATIYYVCSIDYTTFIYQVKNGVDLALGQKNQAGLFFACLFLMKKAWESTSKKMYIDWIYAFVVLTITKSKTAFVVILLYPIMIKMYNYVLVKEKKWMRVITEMLVPFLFLFNYFSAKMYESNIFVQIVDKILTNRIFLNWYILSRNKLTLWGQNIQLSYTGVHNPVRDTWNITTTVDNAYMLAVLVMGIIPVFLFIIGYIMVIRRAFEDRNVVVIVTAVIFALYGISEVKTVSIFFNFVYLYINCKHDKNILKREQLLNNS